MKRDFNFDEVGKKVPYQVPDKFFEEMQDHVMAEVRRPINSHKIILFRWIPAVLATAAVLTAIVFIPLRLNNDPSGNMSQVMSSNSTWIEQMSDEELEAMGDFTDYDVFMYN